jgi:hypothetical protein
MRVRVRAGLAAAALGACAFVAGAGAAGEAAPRAPAAAREPAPVLAMLWHGPPTLFRVRPDTLQRVSRPVPMAGGAGFTAFSPSGSMVAIGGGSAATLRLVDLRRMRRVSGFVPLGGRGFVTALSWPAPRRILALVQGEEARLVVFDPARRQTLSVRRLEGAISAVEVVAGGFVVLVAPVDRIGPARLARVDAYGVLRWARLPSVRAGGERFDDGTGTPGLRNLRPGLAVDPTGRRAFVVSPGDRVTEVDLRTLAVSEHLASFAPAAHAKSIEGQFREARWFAGRLVVAGTDYDGLRDNRLVATSQGVKTIDVDDWSVRTLDAAASSFSIVAGRLLVYGAPYGSSTGTGLDAYDRAGKLVFSLFGDRHVAYVQTEGRYAYLSTANSSRHEIVDVAVGRMLRTVRTKGPLTLLSSVR